MSITPSPSSVNLQLFTQDVPNKQRSSGLKVSFAVFKIICLCLFWYGSSAANSITVKRCLTVFPFPFTLTLVKFLGCALFTYPLLKHMNVRGAFILPKGIFITGILPLSFGKVSAVFFATLSIGSIPVSYANTIKASLPLFSVFFSRILLGQRHTAPIYFALLLIISGVVISSFTEIMFDAWGLMSALISTMSTALLSVYAKKSMLDNNLHYLKMLYFVSLSSLVIMLPVWALHDAASLTTFDYAGLENPVEEIFPHILTIAISDFTQNVAAFGFLSLVSPVSYSVANCMKRVFTIGMSLFILQNPVTGSNLCGMATAITGVALYNKVKYDETRKSKELSSILPIKSDTLNPTYANGNAPPPPPPPLVLKKSHSALVINDYKSYDMRTEKTSPFIA